jgi:hypothetical protein
MHPVARYSQIRSHAQSFRRVAKRSWLGSITDRGRSVGHGVGEPSTDVVIMVLLDD